MGKSLHKERIDPVKASEQFKADLAAMAGPKAAETKVVQRFLGKNFGVASYKFNRWSAELEEAQSLDDALNANFWAAQADMIMGADKTKPKGRGDIIEVRKADTGLYAELLVTEIGKGFVKVKLVSRAELEAVDLPEESPLKTRWNVGSKTHDVIRASDNQVMRGGFQTKASAIAWIEEHSKAMAA